jgi:protein AroM
MTAALGVVTIGQAPRDDVVPDLERLLGATVLQAGALDELDRAEIAALAPGGAAGGSGHLVSRLRDGTEVPLSHDRIIPLVHGALDRVRRAGAETALLLCTGTFPELDPPLPTVTADRLMISTVAALAAGRTLLVICPLPEQRSELEERWRHHAGEVHVAAASPYGRRDAVAAAAADLRAHAAGGSVLGVLDCVGYDLEHQRVASRAMRGPVIVPRVAIGQLLRQLI